MSTETCEHRFDGPISGADIHAFCRKCGAPHPMLGLCAHAPAPATNERNALLDLLMDVWCQFSLPVPERPGAQHDGCLSTLEDVAEVLAQAGRLVRPPGTDKDWWIPAPAKEGR